MDKFNFGSLPQEVAAVLRDALNWRNARDDSHDAIAESHLLELDESTIAFKQWCTEQGEILSRDIDDMPRRPNTLIPQARDADREARLKRIAQSKLHSVPEDRTPGSGS